MTDDFRAQLVPELKVTDLAVSLRFWRDRLGFSVHYSRIEEGFAFLDLNGAQIMLDQRGLGAPGRRGLWETGAMDYPLGRGINFEIQVTDLAAMLARLEAAGTSISFGPEERWYRVNSSEVGVRQFLVQDPDGYLIRLQEKIGQRPVA
ncbi:MAG: VOC family protein [Sphingomonadales bacterium]|nr:VOC family protein [Sphingomonadales bacterium]